MLNSFVILTNFWYRNQLNNSCTRLMLVCQKHTFTIFQQFAFSSRVVFVLSTKQDNKFIVPNTQQIICSFFRQKLTQIISTTYFIIENLYSHVHKYSSHAKINDGIVQKHTNHINYLDISTHSLSRSFFLWPCLSASKGEKKHNKHAIPSRNPKIGIYFIQLFNSLRHVYWSSGSGK